MPSTLAHYALSASGLRVAGFRERELAVASLWAIVPDLDVITALPWLLAAPHLPLGADALTVGARIFGHRGLSHTFLAALLAGLAAWAVTRRRRAGLGASLAWGVHVLADSVSPWPTQPLWPLSTTEWHLPLVTGGDPLLTVVSVGAIAGLLGPIVLDRFELASPATRRGVDRFGRRWGPPLVHASVGAIVLSAGTMAWTSAETGAPVVLPGHTPRTMTLSDPLDAQVDAWDVETRWLPPLEGTTRSIPRINVSGDATSTEPIRHAECGLDRLGPYAPIDDPAWDLRPAGDGWIATARDLTRETTDSGGPRLTMRVDGDVIEGAWMTNEGAGTEWLNLTLPGQLLEGPACP